MGGMGPGWGFCRLPLLEGRAPHQTWAWAMWKGQGEQRAGGKMGNGEWGMGNRWMQMQLDIIQ